MEGYVLVIVKGGRIEEVAYSVERTHVVGLAEDIWPEMDPDTADVKVFGRRGNVIWQPPREE